MGAEPGRRSLASASALMVGATALLNLSMVVYHREMSRRLGIGYGDLAAITGVVNVSAIVLSGLATWLTRQLAHEAALGGESAAVRRLRRLAPSLLLGGFAYLALLWIGGLWLGPWLKLGSDRYIPWAVAVAGGGMVTVVARSLIQGMHRFGTLAVSFVAEGLGRMGLPMLLVGALGVSGALAGMALTGGLIALCALPAFWTHSRRRLPEAVAGLALPAHGWRGLARDTAALALFSLACFLDLFVFKNAWGGLDDEAVAFYSRAALAGKAFLYLATAFNLVALPAISAAHARRQDTRRLLGRFLLGMLGVLALGLALLWAFTPLALRILVGGLPEVPALVPVVRVFALAVVPLALFQLVLFHGLAVGAPGFTRLLAVVILGYHVALSRWHADPLQVVGCLAGAALGLLLGGLWLAWRFGR